MFYITLEKEADTDTSKKFSKNIAAIPRTETAPICGDLNFPITNWSNFSSKDEENQSVLEPFENALYQQGVEFYTRGTKTLDVAFFCNCSLSASPDDVSPQTYDSSEHLPDVLALMKQDVLRLSEPNLFADELKVLAFAHSLARSK